MKKHLFPQTMTALISASLTLILVFLWNEVIRRINRRIHVHRDIIGCGYDTVWSWFSDVQNYSKLYPGWVDTVQQIDNDTFRISDQYNHTYDAKAVRDKEKGIIDLLIQGEVSRTRLFALSDNETLVLHIGEREKFSLPVWLYLKKTINADFRNARKVIENQHL